MNDKDKKKIIEECNTFIKTDEGNKIKKFWNEHSSELMMVLCSDHKLLMDALTKMGFTIHIGTNADSVKFEFTVNDGDIQNKYVGKFSFKEQKGQRRTSDK